VAKGEGAVTRESSYRDLVAWQKAILLVEAVYRETHGWPADERFGLISQIRRAAVSVPSNIAEGSGRSGSAELRKHLSIAHGSVCEVQTHLELAKRLGMSEGSRADALLRQAEEVSQILRGFIRSLDRPVLARSTKPTNSYDSRLTTHD
jgi:four helix bundle protein